MSASKTRSRIFLALKVAVAAAIIGWLVHSKALDFGALRLLVQQPSLFAGTIGLFVMSVIFTTLRWRLLLSAVGVERPLGELLKLQMTALFFNLVIPGGVGGDVLKAIYVAREEKRERWPAIFLISFMERVLGVTSLVVLASGVALVRYDAMIGDPKLRPLVSSIMMLGAGAIVTLTAVTIVVRSNDTRATNWAKSGGRIPQLFGRLFAAVSLLSAAPKKLVVVVALSMTAHACAMLYFTLVATSVTGAEVSFSAVASVYPLGILSLAVPIAPAGLGVGHAAFEGLFATVGIAKGATIYNTYIVGQMGPSVSGAIPYLALKRSGALPTEEEATAKLSAE